MAVTLAVAGCATGSAVPSRIEAARMRDQAMQASTRRFMEVNGPLGTLTCDMHPSICQEDPHAQEKAVPAARPNDRGFWQNFRGRIQEMRQTGRY